MSNDDKVFPKRHEKWLPTGFQEAVESMDLEEIKAKIYECQAHTYEIDKAKDADESLQKAREELKAISEPYAESKKIEVAKAKYCFFVLEGRGVNITPE